MAYGNLKADNLIYDDNGTDTVVPLAHVAGKASVDSQTFTGNVVLPTTTTGVTQAAGDDSTKLATTAYVDQSNFASTTGDTFTGDVKLGDDDYIKLGDSDELSLVHNNSGNSLFVSTTSLTTRGTELYFQEEGDSNKEWIHCLPGGSVELSYDGTKKFETTATGVTITGTLSKTGGSFRIPHPLPALKDTKDLVHSFIEGPQCDNLYRGKVDLVGGTATVNLDTKSDMTTGTFVALNRDVQCFTTNETGWTAVKGSVSGNILTITAQDNTCTDTISWMVVGERQDDAIKSLDMTDSEGNLIVEPDQPVSDTKHAI